MNRMPARRPLASSIFRNRDRETYLYVSYHKCATLYTARVIRAVCQIHGLRTATFDSRHRKVRRWTIRSTDFLLLTDYSRTMLDLSTVSGRGFHVIRDPRDILVSMYYSHRDSHRVNHAEITRNRKQLSHLDLCDGLIYLMNESEFFQRIIRELADWDFHAERFYETSFERLTQNAAGEFEAIFAFLGISVTTSDLRAILQRHSFGQLQAEWQARNPGVETNHYRTGTPGDWKNHLVGRAQSIFRQRYGHLLIKLGYETGDTW